MNQQQAWAGDWGNAYTTRNRVDWRKRVPFWANIMQEIGARSVLEIGCNAGWNLSAIKAAAPWATVRGIDVNASAIKQACVAGLDAWLETIEARVEKTEACHELVFTAGVLIHISPAGLEPMMRNIIALSNRWVLAVEYESEAEAEVIYRGEKDMLWKRPFGRLYQDMGLKLVSPQYAVGKESAFDNCNVSLLEKPNAQ